MQQKCVNNKLNNPWLGVWGNFSKQNESMHPRGSAQSQLCGHWDAYKKKLSWTGGRGSVKISNIFDDSTTTSRTVIQNIKFCWNSATVCWRNTQMCSQPTRIFTMYRAGHYRVKMVQCKEESDVSPQLLAMTCNGHKHGQYGWLHKIDNVSDVIRRLCKHHVQHKPDCPSRLICAKAQPPDKICYREQAFTCIASLTVLEGN